jgi:exopolysaccharide biosynthesis polyprenyl glycosylphosphotransferase
MIHLRHMKRRWIFAVVDAVAVVCSYQFAILFRNHVPLPVFTSILEGSRDFGVSIEWLPWIGLPLALELILYFSGVYDIWYIHSPLGWLKKMIVPNVILVTIGLSVIYLTQNFSFPRSLLLVFGVFNLLLTAGWRSCYYAISNQSKSGVALIFSDLRDVGRVYRQFAKAPFNNFFDVVSGFCLDVSSNVKSDGFLLMPIGRFTEFANKHHVDSVIFVPSATFKVSPTLEFIRQLPTNIRAFFIPSVFEVVMLGVLGNKRVHDVPLVEINLNRDPIAYEIIKRALDLTLGCLIFLVVSPLMLLIGLGIRLTSLGPIFFSQTRVGRGGRPFSILKFRTMHYEPDRLKEFVPATPGDPRVTKIGRFLRLTRLDELPQILNIIKGDMSFVGPRPLVIPEVQQFTRENPAFCERTRIRPGVTGLAQVNGTYETSPEIKLTYDLAYLSKRSLVLDFQIMLRTLKIVLTKAGQ